MESAVPLGLLLAAVLAGCSPSGDSNGEPAQATDANWEQERLAEIEQTFAGREGAGSPVRSDAYVLAAVEGIPEQASPGQEYDLTLVLEIEEGWHINANPATFDYLTPTRFSLEETSGIRLISVQYPKGTQFRLETLEQPIAVYEKNVRIPFRVAVAKNAKPGPLAANARLAVQACDDYTCLAPSQMSVPFTVKIDGI